MNESLTRHFRGRENQEFEHKLEHGYYLGILENYMSKTPWTRERVARDAWQNFFDANNFTLDGLEFETDEKPDRSVVVIRGIAEYPYTRLLHLGGGYKENPKKSGGGHHEGTKIMALHMLRDFGFSKVRFSSQDWILDFYLDTPPVGSTEKTSLRGLYVKLTARDEALEGNTLELVSSEQGTVQTFIDARDLFYHDTNPDFQNPAFDNEQGGFSLHMGTPGNFYLNGQRIHYDVRDTWNTLPHFTCWSHETPETEWGTINLSRDRDIITENEVTQIFLPFLVDSMEPEDLMNTLKILEPFYAVPENNMSFDRKKWFGKEFLRTVVDRCNSLGLVVSFDRNYIALDEKDFLETLKGLGFIPCHEFMSRAGMMCASTMHEEITELYEHAPSPEIKERIACLKRYAQQILQETDTQTIYHTMRLLGLEHEARGALARISDLRAKEIHVFTGKHPYLAGRYDEDFVWISKDSLSTGEIDDVIATYLHELCHEFGDDQSAIFSYALTDVMRRLVKFARTHTTAAAEAQQEWEAIRVDRTWQSKEDFDSHVSPFLIASLEQDPNFQRTSGTQAANIFDLQLKIELISKNLPPANGDIVHILEKMWNEIQADPRVQQWKLLLRNAHHASKPLTPEEQNTLQDAHTRINAIESALRALQQKINILTESLKVFKGGKRLLKEEKLGIPALRADIERNRKEQERIRASVATLQKRKDEYDESLNADIRAARSISSAHNAELHGIPIDLIGASDLFPFLSASLELLEKKWEREQILDRERGKHEFDTLLAWARTQEDSTKKIDRALTHNLIELSESIAHGKTAPSQIMYGQFLYEALQ
ncbi:MAG: hypothetical protein KGI50_04370 [Patescibacteria group bacterium]|nr:hypothetical protein [Patescibacteria group bacterium]MDE2438479.1 hypothetical protein [Patescibacteria group bacterium]